MPDSVDLNESGLPVTVHPRVTLRTPGLSGRVRVHESSSEGTRGADDAQDAFVEAMRRNDIEEDLTVEIDEHRERTESQGTRASGGQDDIVMEVRDPGEAFGQVVLYESEDGVLSWHLPEEGGLEERRTRGSDTLTYRIPREVALLDPASDGEQRGILGAAGKKVVKVLTFRLIKEGSAWVGAHFAERVEAQRKPHRLRTLEPGSHTRPAEAELTSDELRLLGLGRSLLFVHGTFSSAHGGFGRLPVETLRELHTRYGGRVFAFDHPTVSKEPQENVAWLAERLRAVDVRLDVDVVSHSRGGLVSRVMAERPELGHSNDVITVNRLVMVGTPNAGTALADVDHLDQLLDRYLNMLQFVPDNGVTDFLDILLSVLKQVAVGVASGLDGLMSMNPRGRYLTGSMNRPGQTSATYFAAAANYEPPQGSKLVRIARDVGTDLVFGKEHNDLVVPTEGVFTVPGASTFPVVDPLVFDAATAVDHSGYWVRPELNDRLLDWLPG